MKLAAAISQFASQLQNLQDERALDQLLKVINDIEQKNLSNELKNVTRNMRNYISATKRATDKTRDLSDKIAQVIASQFTD